MNALRALPLWILVLMLGAPTPVAAAEGPTSSTAFSEGVSAYRAGQYAIAVRQFQTAEDAGLRSAKLYFNLGLAHYRTRQLEKAQRAFAISSRDADYRGASLFQLALIARSQQRTEEALRLLAAAEAAEPVLASRVAIVRGRITGEPVALTRTQHYAYIGAGYDNNISLSDDRPESLKISSGFVEGLGQLTHRYDRFEGVLRGYLQHAFSADDFDVLAADAHGYLRYRMLGAEAGVGPAVGLLRFGGDSFSRQAGVRAYWLWSRTARGLRHRLVYEGDRVLADAPFESFDGHRHMLRYSLLAATYDLRYSFEWNDREGTAGVDSFASQSPVRHTFFAQRQLIRGARFEVLGGLQYRHTRYRENERFFDAQLNAVEARRSEHRYQARVTTRLAKTRVGHPTAEVRATFNEANLERFNYDRIELIAGLEWF